MLLSVIVPIYNTAKYLPQCIESIINQTYEELEILLVDDGSKDDSFLICEEYRKKDARIKVLRKENGGLISAKKAGLKEAKGEYVGFVDSDDWIDSNFYEQLMEGAVLTKADVVLGDNIVEFDTYKVSIKQGFEHGFYGKSDLIESVYPSLAYKGKLYSLGISPSMCTKIFRRELVAEYQNQVPEIIKGGEDASCTYPCILNAEGMAYVRDCEGYHYRVHNSSMTHRKRKLVLEERMCLLSHIYSSFAKCNYEGIEKQIGLYSLATLEEYINNCFDHAVYKNKEEMARIMETIKEQEAWRCIQEYCWDGLIPKTTKQVIKYIEKSTLLTWIALWTEAKKRQAKSLIKTVLIKLDLYHRK